MITALSPMIFAYGLMAILMLAVLFGDVFFFGPGARVRARRRQLARGHRLNIPRALLVPNRRRS